ncbi:Lrp/AsnC ligand binding domain-containing protein [Kitasatospora sp. NPDC051914]|uniref:Lrp/AsnC ligand binding domain-containing protein n=1 Tax=Kitasatospora sp. NPDC051914 TaxID=3154945 RepID=UPI0034369E21
MMLEPACTAGRLISASPARGPQDSSRSFEVLVSVEVKRDRHAVETFEAALQDIPDVIEAYRLFGSPGCLLRIAVADLKAYERLWIERLTSLSGVTEVNSQIIMKRIKEPRGLPVGRTPHRPA